MSLTVAECKSKLMPYVNSKLDKEKAKWFSDNELLDMLNAVARDLNDKAEVHKERYKRDTTIGKTNYDLQKDIVKIFYFIYKLDDYEDEKWTYAATPLITDVRSTVVLGTTPTEEVEMDVYYLGQVADVTEDTDEVDLPNSLLYDFIELVKRKILTEYGDLTIESYESLLEHKAYMAQQRLPHYDPLDGIVKHWFDHDYDITDNYVGTENVYLSGSTYVWYEA